jgi:hypothetical protein
LRVAFEQLARTDHEVVPDRFAGSNVDRIDPAKLEPGEFRWVDHFKG